MKKLLLLIFIFIASFSANAQAWAQPGAIWYYDIATNAGGVTGYVKITKTADTLIQGHVCDVLVKRATYYKSWFPPGYFDYDYGFEYTYVDNNVVYFWRQNSFFTLYNFNAVVGSSWIVPGPVIDTVQCGATDSVTITQTGTMIVGGQNRNYWVVESDAGSNYGFEINPSYIIEGIGNTATFIPDFIGCIADANEMYGLRCYTDSSGFLYDTGIAPSCDFVNSISENSFQNQGIISPNPANEGFIVSGLKFQVSDEIRLTDALGKTVLSKTITAPTASCKLQTVNFSNGIYFLQLKTKEGTAVKKLVVQR